jgi:hypothetical protein
MIMLPAPEALRRQSIATRGSNSRAKHEGVEPHTSSRGFLARMQFVVWKTEELWRLFLSPDLTLTPAKKSAQSQKIGNAPKSHFCGCESL